MMPSILPFNERTLSLVIEIRFDLPALLLPRCIQDTVKRQRNDVEEALRRRRAGNDFIRLLVGLLTVELDSAIRTEPPTGTILWTLPLTIIESRKTFSTGWKSPHRSSKQARENCTESIPASYGGGKIYIMVIEKLTYNEIERTRILVLVLEFLH
jgi:hypothetical protein